MSRSKLTWPEILQVVAVTLLAATAFGLVLGGCV